MTDVRPAAEQSLTAGTINETFALNGELVVWRARPRHHFTTQGAFTDWQRRHTGTVAGRGPVICFAWQGQTYNLRRDRLIHFLRFGQWPALGQIDDLPGELWKPAFGYEGLYSVSNMGRVRSEARMIDPLRGHSRAVPRRLMKTPRNRSGYPECSLWKDGVQSVWLVHQLVLYAFVGPRPEGLVCCHGDGDPGNPRLENLRWDTARANTADAIRHGTLRRGERCSFSKLTEEDVRAIRSDPRSGYEIAAEFGVSQPVVSRIKSRQIWTHI